ncbi:MAG: hypothetical protein AUH78_11245 [Gemmatimonadetes bacterium 13_1_40CM_4_69_8]|nr:MAG: hypothetical protein AUH78_11245 [Gemmatimonadetes bacterium 13_1_40CM_4_69_8]PYP74546.1 MAG: hypothetical protein DMD41_01310 [Gemmatimonadota bacterium]
MHLVLRRYRIRLGSIAAAARRAQESLVPELRQVPGFATFHLADVGDGMVASLGLFETEEGATLGERLMSGWFREDWPVFRAVPPGLARGEVLVRAEAARPPQVAGEGSGPRLERRGGRPDRRLGRDRRVAALAMVSAAP